MKKLSFLFLLFNTIASICLAQVNPLQASEDSLLTIVNTAKAVEAKAEAYLQIAGIYAGLNIEKETDYINKTMFLIEQSRDRNLISIYYRKIADHWNGVANTPERKELALKAINKGLAVAKEAQVNKEVAILLVRKAMAYRTQGNAVEALKYNEESISYAELSKSDSVKILCQISFANTLLQKDENLGAFKKYMLALNLSEIAKENVFRPNIYKRIGDFYIKVGQLEKAKDYFIKGLDAAKIVKDSINEVGTYVSLITMYADAKDFAFAREYLKILYQKSQKSAFFKQYAIYAESSIIAKEDISKLPAFIKQNSSLVTEYEKYGMFAEVYRIKGLIFTVEQKYDSALFYLLRSKKELNSNNMSAVTSWNSSYAYYLEKTKQYEAAAKYIDENVLLAKKMQSLTFEKDCYENLDSLYIKAGNKPKEAYNKLLLFSIKDSLNKQQKANDLLGVEIDIENQRTERDKIAKEEQRIKRNNLQYMGISAAIIAMFILLVGLGKFKVKPWFIRALGFISFILLFEFIILLVDAQLHALTHGEPLPILLVKIVLIAFLLPLHHWLEHKVLTFVMNQKSPLVTKL